MILRNRLFYIKSSFGTKMFSVKKKKNIFFLHKKINFLTKKYTFVKKLLSYKIYFCKKKQIFYIKKQLFYKNIFFVKAVFLQPLKNIFL